MNSQIVVDIIQERAGVKNAITQYQIAREYYHRTLERIDPRTVRNIIEAKRFEKIPILATPHIPGGYFWPAGRKDYEDWAAKEHRKAIKQIAKIRPVGEGVNKIFPKPIYQRAFDFGKKVLERVG